jgi:hypothetical protein
MLQRRRWERYRKELDVIVRRSGSSDSLACRTLDICEGGLGLLCAEALEVGDDYEFEVREISRTPIVGTIRWCTPSPARGLNLIGVELTGVTARQVEDIKRAIERWKMHNRNR